MAYTNQAIRQLPTITALRNFAGVSKLVGKNILLTGYTAAGDTPQRVYQVFSGSPLVADDGGIFITSAISGYFYVLQKPYNVINAQWYGVLGGGATDTVAIQRVFNSLMTNGAANQNAVVEFPYDSRVDGMVMYGGNSPYSIKIKGNSGGGARGNSQVNWKWVGATTTSMLVIMGANETLIDGMVFDANPSGGTGIKNIVHVASTATDTNLVGTVTAGSSIVATVTAGGTASMAIGMALPIGKGTVNWEIVYVTAISGDTFTAKFIKNHANNERVGGPVTGSEGVKFEWCGFQATSKALGGAASSCILWGNETAGNTPDVAIGGTHNCKFAYSGTAGDAYAAQRYISAGNVKDLKNLINRYTGFSNPIAIEGLGGSFTEIGAEFLNSTDCDITQTGGSGEIVVSSCGAESSGAMFVRSTASNANTVTLIGNTIEYAGGTHPPNDILVDVNGSLNLIGGRFGNIGSGITLAKVRGGNLIQAASGLNSGQITAIGCNFLNAGPNNAGVFLQSNSVPILPDNANTVLSLKLVSLNCYGDNGTLPNYDGQSVGLGISLSGTARSAGVSMEFTGRHGPGWSRFTIPYTAFQAASLTTDLILATVPSGTQITKVIGRVVTGFTGTAGTLLFNFGTSVGGAELLAAFDATMIATLGIVDADMGTTLTRAVVNQGGNLALWIAGGFLRLRLTSSSGNLSLLSVGLLRLHVETDRTLFTG